MSRLSTLMCRLKELRPGREKADLLLDDQYDEGNGKLVSLKQGKGVKVESSDGCVISLIQVHMLQATRLPAYHRRLVKAQAHGSQNLHVPLSLFLPDTEALRDKGLKMEEAATTVPEDDSITLRGKMRGLGTDGAATMAGHHRGVVTCLKAITPSAIGVYCAVHHLNLASTQAGDKVPYIKKFSSVLRQLYDFFENSSVRTTGLEAVQTLLGEESKKLLAPCSTRWLSIERSVNRLKTCFISVVISLQREGEERSDARAVGLYNLVTEYRFVCTILLLCDALPHVSHLSKCFQIADCDYSIIPRMVTSTVQAIQQLKRIDGVNMKGLKAYLEQIENAGIDITTRSNLGDDYFQKSIKAPYLDKLVSNIEARFDDKSIMASFDIFNPAKLPHLSDPPSIEELEHFADYGNNSVKTLVDQFQDIVADCFECLEEWSSFRQFLKENCNEMKHRDIVSRLCCDSTWAAIYPNITTFAKICRVVPIHTANAERIFYHLKLIKTSR